MFMIKIILCSLFISSFAVAEEVKVNINGLNCSLCENGLESKFKTIKNTQKVSVDLNKLEVLLTSVPETTIDENEIKKVVSEAGFIVEKISRSPSKNLFKKGDGKTCSQNC
jgi:copper chaperone CopZ